MSFVLPTPHSKDPMDLVWVGRIEEERLPGALGAKSGITGWAGVPQHSSVCSWSHWPCVRPWICSCSLPTQEPHWQHHLDATQQRLSGVEQDSQGLGVVSPTLPVPSSRGLRSTPSNVTLGSGAPVRAARVGRMSRELASSWVTPGGRRLCDHSICHQGWGGGARGS